MKENTIIFEQPLNEPMRICLRLEHLFRQLNQYRTQASITDSHLALSALLKIVNVIDRPDLKSKLLQTLTQQAMSLSQLKYSTQVDHEKLAQLLLHVDHLINQLHHSSGKFGESLRQNPFLNQIRLHLQNPAGPCNFTTPAYALWLEQPAEIRMDDLKFWAGEVDKIDHIISMILRITRESSNFQNAVAASGMYQQTLDPNLPCQLVRLSFPVNHRIYPEISVGKHRMVIRLLKLDPRENNPNQSLNQDIPFSFSLCRV